MLEVLEVVTAPFIGASSLLFPSEGPAQGPLLQGAAKPAGRLPTPVSCSELMGEGLEGCSGGWGEA